MIIIIIIMITTAKITHIAGVDRTYRIEKAVREEQEERMGEGEGAERPERTSNDITNDVTHVYYAEGRL